MITLENDSLVFRFGDMHPDAELRIDLKRTLRIPDDGKAYPLPPGLGRFPLRHIEDYGQCVPEAWLRRGGVILPMYQAEALWLNFSSRSGYPFAIKIGTGKINAVSGEGWNTGLNRDPQDYVISPKQPWLDGYCVEKGKVRQFIAAPLGEGYTAEEQITGVADTGGLQIQVWPMKAEEYRKIVAERMRRQLRDGISSETSRRMAPARMATAMGLAPGGTMRQKIYDDPYDLAVWDQRNTGRCFLTIANSRQWTRLTGETMPDTPVSAKSYSQAGLPWFDCYDDDAGAVGATAALRGLKSVRQIGAAKLRSIWKDTSLTSPPKVTTLGPENRKVSTGRW